MSDIIAIASVPSNSPQLPLEVCEEIIDIVAGYYNDGDPLEPEARRDLNACRLVCNAWLPRCRFHLYQEIFVDSPDGLQATATFLWRSCFHADRARLLRIRGGNADQSWISTVPLRLPRLRHLTYLILVKVDITQQPSQFYQIYSLLKTRSLVADFRLCVDQDHLSAMPARIATLAAALRLPPVLVANDGAPGYPINTLADLKIVKAWPRRLTGCVCFQIHGVVQDLLKVLSLWTSPVRQWEVTLQSTLLEGLGILSHETRRIWKAISRVFALSVVVYPRDVRFDVVIKDLGTLVLGPVSRTLSLCVLLLSDLIVLQTPARLMGCGLSSTMQMTTH